MELIERPSIQLVDSFQQVRTQSEKLCEPLQTEDFVVQPVVDVSPPKWHLGHTTWFFETFILQPYVKGYQLFNDSYNFVFNSYYESVGKRVVRTDRGNLSRPTVADVFAYRKHVDAHMLAWLENSESIPERAATLLALGLNHEQQHQELLLTDIKYILGNNPLQPLYRPSAAEKSTAANDVSFSEVQEGMHTIGYQEEGFHFDNEKGVHKVFLHPFAIRNSLVTCGEYLEFIRAGGYQNFRFWLSDGWAWVNTEKAEAPMYWHKMDGVWHQYTLGGLQPIDPSVPVTHINYYEAEAFARWAGLRLPTEFEWEAASRRLSPSAPSTSNFVESERYHPVAQKPGNLQLFGDAWEWTQSAYLPYPYFKTEEGAVGEYNGKFMVNQMVLRGGSCATPANHIRATYRNFFQANLRWQFTGIRLAKHI
ncbi:ergothioneine biosynthesis protein EgtB [Imperialibacter roseus]|uniref:Ergothioneine biosynthesis protein EgtB n=1 Tax=Imperialibacter roseus TaxID=1324217 RepID=A0ABZ0IKC7_9BACT|nr:ergothioneine biosynthesis protein EgtB [Imperialibacter roseus]WOK05478.1 ergothioneine biosynthesis protein EgtB [Imperialibacter roseus]